MAGEVNKNKFSERQKQRSRRIKDQLRDQGVGEDHAGKRSLEEAAAEMRSGEGGGRNSGGEAHKGAEKRRQQRQRPR